MNIKCLEDKQEFIWGENKMANLIKKIFGREEIRKIDKLK